MQEVFEKIVERLEELKQREKNRPDDCDENGYGDGEQIYEDGRSQGRYEQTVKIIEIIQQAAEEYNNGWIPCSERLPEVPEGTEDDDCPEFNVTIKGASRAATLRCSSDGTWFDEFGHVYPVIAWKPLPAPYQQNRG